MGSDLEPIYEAPRAGDVKDSQADITKAKQLLGYTPSRGYPEVLEFLAPRVAKWWLPDAVEFIDEVPKTSVGKFDKKVLRERFKAWTPKD